MKDFPYGHSYTSLFDWVLEVLGCMNSHQVNIFLMSLWVIWCERNNLVWNNGGFFPLFMATWVSRYLEETFKFHPFKVKNKRRPVSILT